MRVRGGVLSRLLRVGESPVLVRAWEPARGRVALRAESRRPGRGRRAGGDPAAGQPSRRRGRAAPGARADALRPRRRRRPERVLPPLPPRPAARAGAAPPALAAPAAPAVGLGGAGLGGGQAADRDRAGGPHPAPHRRPLGRPPRRATAAPCATCRRPRRSPAGRRPNWRRWTSRRAARSPCARSPARSPPGAATRPTRAPTGACSPFPRSVPGPCSASGSFGRGDPDSLPAGDLIYLKLVGRLARLGRRATVEEVEEFYAPYEPFRGLAGLWTIGLYR